MTKTFSFMKFQYFYFLISALVIVPGLISLAVNGLRPSIDFTGGSLLEVRVEPKDGQQLRASRDEVQTMIGESYELSGVQLSGKEQLILRGKHISNQHKDAALQQLTAKLGKVTELRFETVGPTLGRELLQKTLFAGVIVSTAITLYVWRQFKSLKFGVSAILAMFHDSLVLIGAFSLFGKFFGAEVDVLFVTALLTTLSFSIHDTIVVFDRVREVRRNHAKLSFREVVDVAVLETLGRSINNSMTIIMMLLALVLLGGDTIRWFAIALLVGAVTGTYSSTFTASPILLLWDDLAEKWAKRK